MPRSLDKDQIQKGMRAIKGRIVSCRDHSNATGLVRVAVVIAGSGRVSSARVKGSMVGTPLGQCILAAVRSATFPAFHSPLVSFVYPFALR